MALSFVRHPPVAGAEGRCYGRLDLPAKPGWTLPDPLRGRRFARVVSSPLIRCRVLAETVAQGAPLLLDARWAELDFGDWEGQPWARIPRRPLDDWAARPWDFQPPGGESTRALVDRVRAALADLAAEPGPVLVVSHAGPLRAALGLLEGWPEARWLSRPVPPLALITPDSSTHDDA